jgi:hypothetical protein
VHSYHAAFGIANIGGVSRQEGVIAAAAGLRLIGENLTQSKM